MDLFRRNLLRDIIEHRSEHWVKEKMMKEAIYYNNFDDRAVCTLCPNKCLIKPGYTGICGTRKFENGKLYALNYGVVSAIQIDPIEKKPLANWHSGTDILSIGTFGCNLKCPFCQNHELVSNLQGGIRLTPEAVVAQAIGNDLEVIAYTYNEPTVFYEMVYDTSREAKKQGLYNVLVTNGYIEEEPLEALMPYIDALNVDIKSYDDQSFYELCGGRLRPVIRTVKIALKYAHVELTMLLVPELYGDLEKFDQFCRWISLELGDLPLHLSRYFPRHKHVTPATDIDWMVKAQTRARKYFTYVYLGNVY